MYNILINGSENYTLPDFDGVKCIVDPEKIGSRITSVIKYPPEPCRLSARSHPATLVYATIEEFKEDIMFIDEKKAAIPPFDQEEKEAVITI